MNVPPETWGWYAYYLWEIHQRKGLRVYDRRAFEEAVAADGIRRLSTRAAELFACFQLDPRRLAQALVDGKAPLYVERREAA